MASATLDAKVTGSLRLTWWYASLEKKREKTKTSQGKRAWMLLLSWNTVSDYYWLLQNALLMQQKLQLTCQFYGANSKLIFFGRNFTIFSTWMKLEIPARTHVGFWQWRDARFLWTSSTLSGSLRIKNKKPAWTHCLCLSAIQLWLLNLLCFQSGPRLCEGHSGNSCEDSWGRWRRRRPGISHWAGHWPSLWFYLHYFMIPIWPEVFAPAPICNMMSSLLFH